MRPRGAREETTRAIADVALQERQSRNRVLIGRSGEDQSAQCGSGQWRAVRVLDLNDYLIRTFKGEPETAAIGDLIPVALAVGAARGCSAPPFFNPSSSVTSFMHVCKS